jgi:hypothetical protein
MAIIRYIAEFEHGQGTPKTDTADVDHRAGATLHHRQLHTGSLVLWQGGEGPRADF